MQETAIMKYDKEKIQKNEAEGKPNKGRKERRENGGWI